MGINNKVLYSIIAATFLAGIGTAYAGPVFTTITLGGNTHTLGDSDVDGNLNVDGTLTGATVNDLQTQIDGNTSAFGI